MPDLTQVKHDMSFTLGSGNGHSETFQVTNVRARKLLDAEKALLAKTDTESGEQDVLDMAIEQILMFLKEEDVERFKSLLDREDDPLPIWQVWEMRRLLWETQTGRPLDEPSSSPPGRGRTAQRSEGA